MMSYRGAASGATGTAYDCSSSWTAPRLSIRSDPVSVYPGLGSDGVDRFAHAQVCLSQAKHCAMTACIPSSVERTCDECRAGYQERAPPKAALGAKVLASVQTRVSSARLHQVQSRIYVQRFLWPRSISSACHLHFMVGLLSRYSGQPGSRAEPRDPVLQFHGPTPP